MPSEIALVRIIEHLVSPPGGPLLLALAGLLLSRRRPRVGHTLAVVGLGLLFLTMLPVTGRVLLSSLERYPALKPEDLAGIKAQAIVILAGGRRPDAKEFGGDTVSARSLERVRYGAFLQRHTGLPIVVSGGHPFGSSVSEAELMRRALLEFGIKDVVTENESANTAENARFTARLFARGSRILLVTHASHMARAVAQFEAQGLRVIPAPTGFTTRQPGPELLQWLPSADGAALTARALHEWLGRLWYAVRY